MSVQSGISLSRRFARLLHHALLALLVAYALKFAFDVTGIAAADTLSWRVFNALNLDRQAKRSAPGDTAVVLINDTYFEGPLRQASPLDRGEMAKLLDEIGAGIEPARQPVVAIDLDLSHAPADDRIKAAQLDAAIISLAGRARVVLLCPFARTAALRAQQVRWSRDLIRAVAAAHPDGPGLAFAASDLVTRTGVVMTYGAATDALGVVAGRALLSGEAHRQQPRDCGEIEHRTTLSDARADERTKISPAGLVAFHRMPIDSSERVGERLRSKAPRAVFVGGSYALAADEFFSAANTSEPGVVFHAAVSRSIREPLSDLSPSLHVIVQFAGVLLVLWAGHPIGQAIFGLMTPDAVTPRPPLRVGVLDILWAHDSHLSRPQLAETWLRWLLGMLLLLVLLLAFVLLFVAFSAFVYELSGAWFDGLLGGIAVWLKVVAGESQHLLARTNPVERRTSDAGVSAAPPVPTAPTFGWIGISTLVRTAVLLAGLTYLVLKFIGHGAHP